MKIHTISNEKIKIYISRKEMSSRNISYSEIDYNSNKTKILITEILNYAGIKNNTNILIETFPAFNKGAIIQITKLSPMSINYNLLS